jgi:hypothetical protein
MTNAVTRKTIKQIEVNANITVFVVQERSRFFSVFGRYVSETDGHVFACQDFCTKFEANEYAKKVVAKFSK